ERAAEVGDGVGEMTDADRLDSREHRLRAGLVGTKEPLQAGASRALRNGEHAADAPHPAVERELATRGVLRKAVAGNLARRREQRERDGQVETRPLLLQLRRSEVDRDPALPSRPLQLGREDPAAYALFRLLAGPVGQPGDRERRRTELDVRLDLDATRFQTDEGKGDRACE